MKNVKLVNLMKVVALAGVVGMGSIACSPDGASDALGLGKDGSKKDSAASSVVKPSPTPSVAVGETCEGYEDKAFATATGVDEQRAKVFLEREVETKLKGETKDFQVKCESVNGRAATSYRCSAYLKYTIKDSWVTKTIRSDSANQPFFRDANAKAYLETVAEELTKDSKGKARNISISKVPNHELSAHESDKGEVYWKLSYQVPGCK